MVRAICASSLRSVGEVPVFASFAAQIPAAVGVLAASMAIGGFLNQAGPALRKADERELRQQAAKGGLVGLLLGLVVAVSSVTVPI